MSALAVDLFCGLGGWTDGLIAEGWDVVGFDIEQHVYGADRYPAQLVIQDVRTIDGAQFKDADLIVASPPCQEYSYMAMPWTRAKAKAAAIRADETGEALRKLNELFNACFRIQREACEAGRFIPMVVENVKGAQPWVGRARWSFGSYFLWGDVPALMPPVKYHQRQKCSQGEQWNINRANFSGSLGWDEGLKNTGIKVENQMHIRTGARSTPHLTNAAEHVKSSAAAGGWFGDGNAKGHGRQHAHKSKARRAASAKIAKIPLTLSTHIARVFLPGERSEKAA